MYVYTHRPRGPTLGEISYALAEITEIKFEIAKSSSLKRNLKSESVHNLQDFRKIS